MTGRKLNVTWWIAIFLAVALLALVVMWFVLRSQRHQAIALLEECGTKVHLREVDESFFESLARGALPGEKAVVSVRILPDLQRLTELAGQNRGVATIEGTDLFLNVEVAPTSTDPRGDLERQIAALRHFTWLSHIDVKNTVLDDQLFRQLLVHRRCEILNASGTEITDAAFEGIGNLASLDQISLAHTNIADKALAELARCTSLTGINVGHTKVTDQGLSHLTHLTKLEYLDLTHTAISSDGLAHVGKLTTLELLGISDTKVNDRGLRHLHKLQNLRWLSVEGSEVTMEGLEEFFDDVPSADRRQGIGGGRPLRGRGAP